MSSSSGGSTPLRLRIRCLPSPTARPSQGELIDLSVPHDHRIFDLRRELGDRTQTDIAKLCILLKDDRPADLFDTDFVTQVLRETDAIIAVPSRSGEAMAFAAGDSVEVYWPEDDTWLSAAVSGSTVASKKRIVHAPGY